MESKLVANIDNFEKLVESGGIFVDKTLFIRDFLTKNLNGLTIITRPRKFGKSLNISMLRHFLDIRENSESLFKNFNVWHDKETMSHMNRHPVIHLSFKDLEASSYDSFVYAVYKRILKVYEYHKCILDNLNDQYYVEKYLSFLKDAQKDADVQESLYELTEYLHMAYNKKVIVLIDEYDSPGHDAYGKDYSDKIAEFLRKLYGHTAKSNPHIYRALLMGILTVAKNSMFSGLNNAVFYTILDERYNQYFGFTEEEVKTLMEKKGLSLKLAKRWYNGYNFSGKTIYNPFSIINFIETREAQPYWVDTGFDQEKVIASSLKCHTRIVRQDLNGLVKGKSISSKISKRILLDEISGKELNFLTFLTHAGYLTTKSISKKGTYKLVIPNNEVKELFKDIIASILQEVSKDNLILMLIQDRDQDFEEELNAILNKNLSYFDMREGSALHAMIMQYAITLDRNDDRYDAKSNIDSSPDIIVESREDRLGLVIEIKKANNEEELLKKAKEGMKQIKEKEYYSFFNKKIKEIKLASIAFNRKKFILKTDKILLN